MVLTSPETSANNSNHENVPRHDQVQAVTSVLSSFGLTHRATNDSLIEHDSNLSQRWAEDVKDLAQASKSKAAVLLLAWREGEGRYTVSTSESLKALKDIFENQYNFLVHTETLTTKETPPRFQLGCIISEFLRQYARPNTLLIIYYGGHGNLSPDRQDLILRGGNRDRKNPVQTELSWSMVEPLLYSIQADLLLLFDCCHAGLVSRSGRNWPNSEAHFEFMGSTTSDRKARGPKDRASFTKSLINALSHLSVRAHGFDTSTLKHAIENDPDFQSSDQQPVLSSCGAKTSQERLWIRPLALKPLSGVEDREIDSVDSVKFYLRLKYVFTQKPSEADLTMLSQSVWNLIRHQRLPIQEVLYGGLSKQDTRMDPADAALFLLRIKNCRTKLPKVNLEATASEESTQITTSQVANVPDEDISLPRSSSLRRRTTLQRKMTQPEVVFRMECGPTADTQRARHRYFIVFDLLLFSFVVVVWWLRWRIT